MNAPASTIVKKPVINWNVNGRKFWELYALLTEVHALDAALFQDAGSIRQLLEIGGAALVAKHHGNKIAAGNIVSGIVAQLERRITHATLTKIAKDVSTIAEDFKLAHYKHCKDPSACDPAFKARKGDVKVCDVCLTYPLFTYYASATEKTELCTSCFQVASELCTQGNAYGALLNEFKQRRLRAETYY